jgi:hypothetical protein
VAIGYPIFSAIAPLWDWDAKIAPKEVDDDDAEVRSVECRVQQVLVVLAGVSA